MNDCIEARVSRTAKYAVGSIPVGGRSYSVLAHRLAWEQANQQTIPPGMVIRHTCDNPPCVNPEHLLLGTQSQNMQDKVQRGRANMLRSDCFMGHRMSEANSLWTNGRRECRRCREIRRK